MLSNFMHNSQKLKPALMSIQLETDKPSVILPSKDMSWQSKEMSDTHNHVDEERRQKRH